MEQSSIKKLNSDNMAPVSYPAFDNHTSSSAVINQSPGTRYHPDSNAARFGPCMSPIFSDTAVLNDWNFPYVSNFRHGYVEDAYMIDHHQTIRDYYSNNTPFSTQDIFNKSTVDGLSMYPSMDMNLDLLSANSENSADIQDPAIEAGASSSFGRPISTTDKSHGTQRKKLFTRKHVKPG